MTKSEFLEKLRHALANDLSGPVIQENVNYYDSYISDEVRKGRSEAAVIDELGDPWVIAQTIIESVEVKRNTKGEYTHESKRQDYEEREPGRTGGPHVFEFDIWWKKLLLVLVIVGVVWLIITVITGLFNLLAPVLVPLLLIIIIVRLIGGNRRQR